MNLAIKMPRKAGKVMLTLLILQQWSPDALKGSISAHLGRKAL
jgi:hypothetical protein